jgi:hypothetical protein
VSPTPEDLPDVQFYDNNFSLQKHLRANNITYLKNVIMPVFLFYCIVLGIDQHYLRWMSSTSNPNIRVQMNFVSCIAILHNGASFLMAKGNGFSTHLWQNMDWWLSFHAPWDEKDQVWVFPG